MLKLWSWKIRKGLERENFKIFKENESFISSEENLLYEEPRTSSSSAEKRKLRSEAGIEFIFETVCD